MAHFNFSRKHTPLYFFGLLVGCHSGERFEARDFPPDHEPPQVDLPQVEAPETAPGSESGPNPQAAKRSGSIVVDVVEAPLFPGATEVGRLSLSPTFCWVKQLGQVETQAWQSRRQWVQETMTQWEANSGLTIQWVSECDKTIAVPSGRGEVRILLDDRDGESDSLIADCTQPDESGPWALYPAEAQGWAQCAWNMVIPFDEQRPRVILHLAGHALGVSHQHADWQGQECPWEIADNEIENVSSPADDSLSPYVQEYDSRSVMHPAPGGLSAYEAGAFRDCPAEGGMSLSNRDALAIEMIYPRSLTPRLGSSGWLPFAGTPVFRDDQPQVIVADWIGRGASNLWFDASYWSLVSDLEAGLEIRTELPPVIHLDAESSYVGHIFTDPFGEIHWMQTKVEVSNVKHASVVVSLL